MANTQREQSFRYPVAILISDIHYNVNTLSIADSATRQAVNRANELNVPIISCGDMHDSKANLRGECVNAIIETMKLCKVKPYVLVGNHSRLNEKSKQHALNFLEPYCIIVDEPMDMPLTGAHGIPYYHDPDELRSYLKTISKSSTLIMHQGLTGSKSGDYIQDKSAIRPEDVAGMRVISGHYHTRQYIPLPGGGLWSYVGNPYTLNFAEANDPSKGYQILMDDGTLEFVPTNLRKHVVIELEANQDLKSAKLPDITLEDLVLVKLKGTKTQLSNINKQDIRLDLGLGDFRLDLIPTDTTISSTTEKPLSQNELLDSMIDRLNDSGEDQKIRLKELWKGLI